MKKKLISILYLILIIFITFDVLKNANMVMEMVKFSYKLWINNIFPSLFPFFILSEILIRFGFVEFISEIFKGIMQKIFHIKGEAAFVFIMSMISGFPSNSKYVKESKLKLNFDKSILFNLFKSSSLLISIFKISTNAGTS